MVKVKGFVVNLALNIIFFFFSNFFVPFFSGVKKPAGQY